MIGIAKVLSSDILGGTARDAAERNDTLTCPDRRRDRLSLKGEGFKESGTGRIQRSTAGGGGGTGRTRAECGSKREWRGNVTLQNRIKFGRMKGSRRARVFGSGCVDYVVYQHGPYEQWEGIGNGYFECSGWKEARTAVGQELL